MAASGDGTPSPFLFQSIEWSTEPATEAKDQFRPIASNGRFEKDTSNGGRLGSDKSDRLVVDLLPEIQVGLWKDGVFTKALSGSKSIVSLQCFCVKPAHEITRPSARCAGSTSAHGCPWRRLHNGNLGDGPRSLRADDRPDDRAGRRFLARGQRCGEILWREEHDPVPRAVSSPVPQLPHQRIERARAALLCQCGCSFWVLQIMIGRSVCRLVGLVGLVG